MRGLRDESGGIVVFVALSPACLLGFLALANDVGVFFFTKRNRRAPQELAIMPLAPLVVAVGKLEFGGINNVAIEATNTARAGGARGLENPLAASPIRCMANYLFVVLPIIDLPVTLCSGEPSWEREVTMKDRAKAGNDANRLGSSAVFPSRGRLRKAAQALAYGPKRGVGK